MEQNNGEIFTNGRRATSALEKLQVWQNSSAVFFVHAPDGVSSVRFVVGNEPVEAKYEPGKRCWRVYVQPLHFARPGSFCYTVRAVDEYGNNTVLGRGTLVVVESPVAEATGSILPANAYAYLGSQLEHDGEDRRAETGHRGFGLEPDGRRQARHRSRSLAQEPADVRRPLRNPR